MRLEEGQWQAKISTSDCTAHEDHLIRKILLKMSVNVLSVVVFELSSMFSDATNADIRFLIEYKNYRWTGGIFYLVHEWTKELNDFFLQI